MVDFDSGVDYYEILQVHPSAHQEVIKRAYRTIVGLLQAHPDLGGSHEDAVRVNKAFQVLSDPETRQAYDEARSQRAAMRRRAEHTRSAQTHTVHQGRYESSGGRHAGNGRAGAHRSGVSSHGTQTVYCPRCGARNRLPQLSEHRLAICGKCHAPLFSMQRSPVEPILPAGDLRISAMLTGRLISQGELSLQRAQLPADHRLICLRCRFEWSQQQGSALPRHCPHCHSAKWSDFRLFRCRHCTHQFTTENLTARPYRLFPECPSCHKRHWHAGFEHSMLTWLLRKVAG